MTFTRLRTSTRVVLGGLAALVGLGAITTELSVASAEPTTTDHTGDHTGALSPTSAYVPGTFQSCAAKFGLTKSNADLETFDVQNGSPAITPTPTIGTELIPLITVSDGTTTVTCEANIAWTDSATFDSGFNTNAFVAGTAILYPASRPDPNGFRIIPAVGVQIYIDGTTPLTATTRTLTFGDTLAVGSTVTIGSQPVEVQAPWQPYGATPNNSSVLTTTWFQRVLDAVQSTGDPAQRTFLHDFLATQYGGTDPSSMCTTDAATANALFATMDTLMAGWGGTWMLPTNCGTLENNTYAVGQILQYGAQIAEPSIVVTVAGPPAPTTTTTSTSTTTTSSTTTSTSTSSTTSTTIVPTTTTVASDPIVPAFTG